MKRRKINKLAIGGLLLVLAALCLVAYNFAEQALVESQTESVERQLEPALQEQRGPKESALGGTVKIDGKSYCGILRIPSLSLKLPVCDELSESNLKVSPCRYKGSVAEGGLIIAGHNYWRHFGCLCDLEEGAEISIKCPEGGSVVYEVDHVEVLPGNAVEEMSAGGWDLTLFTCTPDSASRVTVRCRLTGTR